MKLRLILAGVVHQTIQRIIHVKFDIPSMVRPKVPFLTEVGRQKRLSGARTKRWPIKDWRDILFADESPFHTKQNMGEEGAKTMNCQQPIIL